MRPRGNGGRSGRGRSSRTRRRTRTGMGRSRRSHSCQGSPPSAHPAMRFGEFTTPYSSHRGGRRSRSRNRSRNQSRRRCAATARPRGSVVACVEAVEALAHACFLLSLLRGPGGRAFRRCSGVCPFVPCSLGALWGPVGPCRPGAVMRGRGCLLTHSKLEIRAAVNIGRKDEPGVQRTLGIRGTGGRRMAEESRRSLVTGRPRNCLCTGLTERVRVATVVRAAGPNMVAEQ